MRDCPVRQRETGESPIIPSTSHMKLTLISAQSRHTLQQTFTTNDSAGEGKRLAFAAMRQLLEELEAADGPALYVYTSLFRLCFVDGDNYRLPTILRCTPYYRTAESGEHIASFQIEFPGSPDMERSDRNWTRWTTSDMDEAVQMVLASLQQSAFSPNRD